MMMSRYSEDRYEDYFSSPSASPQGRRYVLQNFNMRKQRERSYKRHYESPKFYPDYHDIRKVPPSETSVESNNSYGSHGNHIGLSNKVMPTNIPKAISPRKTPRDPPLYVVTPRKDLHAANTKVAPKSESVAVGTKSKTKDSAKVAEALTVTKNEKGMTPRDEYMVTKLYGHEIIYLKPSEIRYTHDEITSHFTDGRSLLATFKSLLYGKIEIRQGGDGVPLIEVMKTDERGKQLWFVVNGNRRLFIFRRLERCGALEKMQVVARRYDSIEMDKHFSTRNLGQTISVANDATIRAKIKKEVLAWKEWKAKQPKDNAKSSTTTKAKPKKATDANKNSSCCCVS